jgi:hypothetical protein
LNVQYRPVMPRRWGGRVTPAIYLQNILAGIDQLVHGSNMRGWGSPATPDPVLFVPRGFDPGAQRFRSMYVVDSRPIITGAVLTDARPSSDPVEGNVVQFTLNNEGARRFKVETGKHVGDNMAIVLDQRVMGLRDDREPFSGETLHEPELPERLRAVQLLREHTRRQVAELLLGAGRGERRVANVVLEVERRIVDPALAPEAGRRRGELLPIARHEVQPGADVVQHVAKRRRRPLEPRILVRLRRRADSRRAGRARVVRSPGADHVPRHVLSGVE